MLKRFELSNYKNFKENIVIDLGRIGGYQFSSDCITDGKIGKMLIYGKNATGKTNLGNALMDIKLNLYGMGSRISEDEIFLNANMFFALIKMNWSMNIASQPIKNW